MKKLQALMVAALLAGGASSAIAQDPQPQPQGAGREMARGGMQALMQGITLTSDQQAKIDSITRKYSAQRQEIVQDQSIEGPAKRPKIRELMMKQQDEIKAVLTAEQRTVYEKNVADMQARMQQGGGQRPPQR